MRSSRSKRKRRQSSGGTCFSNLFRYAPPVDNATHALCGLLIAEVAIQARERKGRDLSDTARTGMRWVSVLSNNLPDLDVLYAGHYGDELGYILHHRGHTHTALMGPLLGLALFVTWLFACSCRGRPVNSSQRLMLLGLCILGPWTHLGLDALNNYGVHPFWPMDTQWVYGDSLFIIEPWLWVVLVPGLVFGLTNRWARRALWLVLVLGAALAWTLEMVPWPVALALTLGGVASVSYSARVDASTRLYATLGGTAAVIAVFVIGAQLADASVRGRAEPTGTLLDVVVTPSPGNPLCFGVITVSLDADLYVARAGSLTLIPQIVGPKACRVQPTGLTVGLHAPTASNTLSVVWEGEWRGSQQELQHLVRTHCHVSAWMRFARVPFWSRREDNQWLLGDLRFDRDEGIDFDEFIVQEPPAKCPPWVPNWSLPRDDLVGVPSD